MIETKYLIIGNSAGGIGAIEGIRKVDSKGTVILVSPEPYPAYSRPLVAEYLTGKCTFERMLYRPADFYDTYDIRTFLGDGLAKLHLEERTAELESGKRIGWEKLLLATGGSPIAPPLAGRERAGVFTFATLGDAEKISNYLNQATQAVVIGGGLIGMSVAESLTKRGIAITIIEMKDFILNTILNAEAAALAEDVIRKAGVNIITGHTAAEICGGRSGAVNGVILDDGRQIQSSMVVMAIGVRPRTDLVSGTDIKVNRGILVDSHMETSVPGIYACGDVAEAYDAVYGCNRLIPIWPNAYLGGRTGGLNMAGLITEYPGGTAMNSLNYFGLEIVTAGMVNPPDDTFEVLSQVNGENYRRLVLQDGIIVGMAFIGNIEKTGIVFSLIRDKVNVSEFKELLTEDDLNLAALPKYVWRSKLESPTNGAVSTVLV